MTEREQQAFLRDVYAFQQQVAPGITPGEIDAMTNREIDERCDRALSDERDRVHAEIVQRFRNYGTLERKPEE